MYNTNRFNYAPKDLNNLNYINNQQNNRIISPPIINDQINENYYFNEANLNQNQNIVYKNIGINENLINSHNLNYPINFNQQKNPLYLDYVTSFNNQNNFYPVSSPNNIYYENIIPPNNKYLFTDNNIYNNYPDRIIQQNNKQYISQNQNNNKHNINEIDQYKNGLKLNITNCETQYPLTYLKEDPFKKRKAYIQNYNKNVKNYRMNKKDSENNLYVRTFQKSKNRKNFNLSQINPMQDLSTGLPNIPMKNKSKSKNKEYTIKNIRGKKMENFNKSSYNFHKKNKSHLDFNNNIENSYKEDSSFNNKNLLSNTREKNEYNNNIRNSYNYKYAKSQNYNKEPKNNNKKQSFEKNNINLLMEQEKYKYKIKKFIDHLEQYYIISFHNYFYYFIQQLKFFNHVKINENKNSLLKRFQRNKHLINSNNYSFNRYPLNSNLNNKYYINYSNNNLDNLSNDNAYLNIIRKVYIPKKNIGQVELNTNSLNINNNINNINYSYSHNKNKSLDFLPYIANPYQHNTTYIDNRLNLSTDFYPRYNFNIPHYNRNNHKENSVDKINNDNNIRKSYEYINKSHDNLQNKLSPTASSLHKRINNSIDKKSIIYVKPKANKFNLKRIIINNKINELSNINDTNNINHGHTVDDLNSNNYIYSNIFNNKKKLTENILYNPHNNSFSIKDVEGLRSPVKEKFQNHIEDENENKNNDYRNDYISNNENENNINEIIGNEDLIEETIIKDICTYDKKLWVFIKYVISPRAKQNFLKMKVKRRLGKSKGSKNIFINNEINNRLAPIHTDSIELISPLSLLDHYSINNKLIMKEISEERESQNNSNNDDENLNNCISNMVNILEGYKKQNILYFYNYFFNSINNYDKDLPHKKIFKNILTNFQNFDFYNNKNNIYYSNENSEYENSKTSRKIKEHWKRNLFHDIEKIKVEKNNFNEDDNSFSGKINIDRKKMNNFNIYNNLTIKCNSTRGRLSTEEIKRRELIEKNKNKINEKGNNANNNININEKEEKQKDIILAKQKLEETLNCFKISLINYILKNKKLVKNIEKENEEEEYEEEEEEEDDDDNN